MKKGLSLLIYYYFLILFLEVCNKIYVFKHLNIGLFFTCLFIALPALILYGITKLFKKHKHQYIFSIIASLIIIIFFISNYLYYDLFSVPFSISTLSLANQAVDFYTIVFESIYNNYSYIIMTFIPFIIFLISHKLFDFTNYYYKYSKIIISIIIMYVISVLVFLPFKDSAYKYYFEKDNMIESINYFGLITGNRLSIQRYIFGFDEKIVTSNNANTVTELPVDIKTNSLNIDFNKLVESTENEEEKQLYNYFSQEIPTNQNDYTGMYKDKNLIFILAEGFNSIAVDPVLTPTLYKLSHTGFVFNNYYSPVFLSTTGGEFQATTGLIPTQDILSLWRKNNPTFSYALGNSFGNIGYKANAFHDWTYSYYKRNITMPTLGFTNYMGCKNGMEELIDCSWLPSDIDLMNATADKYINEEKFVTYYVSVSGHAPYNFTGGNKISIKNKSYVENLNYSDSVKAYLAAQIEFDRAMETLINKLKESNKLDNTVIVITGDHYPYTLSTDEINEISNYERDELFEVNHSNLIIWNNNDDVIRTVDKVGSQIDVLPTILNLFGISYDSRMIIGNDILSDSEGLAIFSNHSWISDYGKYNAGTNKFDKTSDLNITEDYVNNMINRVDNSFAVSKMILETDIYKKVLGDK